MAAFSFCAPSSCLLLRLESSSNGGIFSESAQSYQLEYRREMTENIVQLVLSKLADAEVKENFHRYGIYNKVEAVRLELSRIQALIKDADKKHIKDERQKNWLNEVRNVANLIKDAIDTFLSEVPPKPQNPASMTEPRIRKKLPAVHKLVDELTMIEERLIEIEISRVRYGIEFNTLGEETEENELPITLPMLPDTDTDVVGFKEESQEDGNKGHQFRMGDPDLEKRQEDETKGHSTLDSLTTTPEGNKEEKLLYILIGLIGFLATAAGIAAIPVPENSRKKTLGKICSGLFDILLLIFLGAMIILGIYVQISKATGMKHISISYVVFFFILVVCSILKMVMVAVGDF
ncbi:uncharacterized protein LOC144549051 [Carex rostrata]